MKTKIGVVIHTKLRDTLFTRREIQRLNDLGEVQWTESPDPINVDDAIQILKDCAIGIGSWGTPRPDARIMEACPGLRLWEHAAGSVKNMFGPHLKGHDLRIASCKTAIADCVAEMTLGEIILGLRRVYEHASANKSSRTGKPANLKVLFGSKVGVIGASEVGKRVIHLLKPFGCDICVYDPYLSGERAMSMGALLYKDLLQFCRDCDVITLHTPLTPETSRLLSASQFQAMKDDAVFLNTSRGGCIDESALIDELQKGRLFAFLDVSDPEPPAEDSPIRKLPNVLYTSHIAGPASFNIGKQVVNDVEAFLNGREPLCVITEEMLPRIA